MLCNTNPRCGELPRRGFCIMVVATEEKAAAAALYRLTGSRLLSFVFVSSSRRRRINSTG